MKLGDVAFANSMCKAPGSNTSSGNRKGSCNLDGVSKTLESIQIVGFRLGAVSWNQGPHTRLPVGSICVLFWNASLPFLSENLLLENTFEAGTWKIHLKQEHGNRPTELDLMKITLIKEDSSLLIWKWLTHPQIVQCSLFSPFLYSKSKTVFLCKISTHSMYIKVWRKCSRKYKNWPLKFSKQLVWVFKYYWNPWKTGALL